MERSTAEAELRAVDREYAAGSMNAFGPPSQQERILSEMEAVGRLQGCMLERANAVVQLTDSPFDPADTDQGGGGTKGGVPSDTKIHRVVHSVVQRLGAGVDNHTDGGTPQHPQVSALHDGAFEDMTAHFAALEGSMGHITDNLQGMQWHLDSLRQLLGSVERVSTNSQR